MAIQNDPQAAAPTVTPYVPGTTQFAAMGNQCVEAGDRVIWTSTAYETLNAANTVRPDADHFLPHFVYRPAYSRLQDPDDPTVTTSNPRESVGGNAGGTPAIRVDFGPLYCPWAGNLQIEGGTGPGAPFGNLLITWLWDRARRDRLKWYEVFASIMHAAVYAQPLNPERMPRVPTNQRGFTRQTLTFYNIAAGTRIPRPVCAQSVWTPDAQSLALDTGPGSLTAIAVGSFGWPIYLGPFTFVTPVAAISVLTFGIVF